MAVSGGGKTVVLASGLNVYALDFRGAFKTDPLPPASRPRDESPPLR